jgi:hypothetical protein
MMPPSIPPLAATRLARDRDVVRLEVDWTLRDDAALSGLEEVFRAFVSLGERGGYASQQAPPWDSSLRVREGLRMSPVALEATLETEGVDPGAWNVLRAALAGAAGEASSVDAIRIEGTAELRAPRLTVAEPDVLDEDAYPPASSRIGFPFSFDGSASSWMRRCLVEFGRSIQPDEVVGLGVWVAPWYDLVEAGGFAPPLVSPVDAVSVRGKVSQFDDVTAEVLVDRLEATDAAWNVLFNAVASFAHGRLPIVSIMVE